SARVAAMRDEADFLKALAASPGDELTRLAFADWLDERGDQRAPWGRDPDIFPWTAGGTISPLPALLKAVVRGGANVHRAFTALRKIGTPAVAPLVEQARGASGWRGSTVNLVLEQMGPEIRAALPDLLRAADDPD